MLYFGGNCILLFSFIVSMLYIIAFISIIFSGNISISDTIASGSAEAVRFCVQVAGSICLWCAVTEVYEQCGITRALTGSLRGVISRLFPKSSADEEVCSAVSENISANILGLGNAATPAGIRAAKKIAEFGSGREISDELCMLVVLNTASIQLIPTTTAALRASAGASAPFDILPAVWVSTVCSMAVGLLSASLLKRVWH